MLLNEILFDSKLEIKYHDGAINEPDRKGLPLFFTTLISNTGDLVRELKGTHRLLDVISHRLHMLIASLDRFLSRFTFLFPHRLYEISECLLLLGSFLGVNSSLSDDFDEVVVSVIVNDCLFGWLLDVVN